MSDVLAEVHAERERQTAKWGEQNHPDGTGGPLAGAVAGLLREMCQANGPGQDTYASILAEEVGEAFAESDPPKVRAELIQVAAVAVAWVEALDRRDWAPEPGDRIGG